MLIAGCITPSRSISQRKNTFKPKEVYKSGTLVITQVSKNAYVHVSYKQTNDFGNVPCNGLVVRSSDEVIVFDTPTNDKSAEELIRWIKEKLHCKINAVIPTHFHDDCLGGLKAFDENNIPSYANVKTIELAKENNYTVP
ncbi:MAG: MBL fold metallo-hydrolase, partial [Bacteroidetes bacterium]|nr:MBL fold metallo-hydrolase [Bacteroidota bacterium]